MGKDSPERQWAWNIAKTANRRAQQFGLPGRLSRRDIKQIFEMFGYRCLACGRTDKLSLDHIKPMCKGGANDLSNLQVLCCTCNYRKGRRQLDYRPPSQRKS